ncbi:MAG: HIT domain-containing protein [Candidatus Paceibacterota bacterium]
MKNCIFCKIIKKEIPCERIYENKNFLVFLDIKPVSDGHILIIPKKHIVWMQEADDKTISDIFKLSKKIILALKKGLKCDYVQLGIVGNEVPHFHIHLIPRYFNNVFPNLPTKEYLDGESFNVAKKIISKL